MAGKVRDFVSRLRTALKHASTIIELEAEWSQVRSEWADVLDVMARREERSRKRDRAAIGAAPDESPSGDPPQEPLVQGGAKNELRAHARRIGLL